jgi:hypothetical protein
VDQRQIELLEQHFPEVRRINGAYTNLFDSVESSSSKLPSVQWIGVAFNRTQSTLSQLSASPVGPRRSQQNHLKYIAEQSSASPLPVQWIGSAVNACNTITVLQ